MKVILKKYSKRFLYCILILSPIIFNHEFAFSQDLVSSFEYEWQIREYEVYIPSNYHSNMPVVLSLHGATEGIRLHKDYSRVHEVGDTSGFITVYAKGIPRCWNTGLAWNSFPIINSMINDVGFISALIDTIDAQYDIDLSRIYCCGFGQGGAMAYKLLGEHGQRFAAIASVNGLINPNLVETCQPVRNFPIFHFHGTEDEFEPWYGGADNNLWTGPETINFWLEKNGCSTFADTVSLPDIDSTDGSTVEKISYNNCQGDGCLIFYKILNGGHNWPGVPVQYFWEGNKNMDINAGVEIWNFFENYTNPLMNLAYGKSKEILTLYLEPEQDTLIINATIRNPEDHPISVKAFVNSVYSTFSDSFQLFDDGLHVDGEASDKIYSTKTWLSNMEEDLFEVRLRTTDVDTGITTRLHHPSYFTTIGPIRAMAMPFDYLSAARKQKNQTSFYQ